MRIIILITVFWLTLTAGAFAQQGISSHDSSQPVEITADSLAVNQENETAEFSGNVEATQGAIKLRADKMIVHYRSGQKRENNENSVSMIEVFGHVFLSTRDETAKGSKGKYDVDNKTITLTGSVALTQGEKVIKGDKLVYNIATGRSKLSSAPTDTQKGGRVKGVFVPN